MFQHAIAGVLVSPSVDPARHWWRACLAVSLVCRKLSASEHVLQLLLRVCVCVRECVTGVSYFAPNFVVGIFGAKITMFCRCRQVLTVSVIICLVL